MPLQDKAKGKPLPPRSTAQASLAVKEKVTLHSFVRCDEQEGLGMRMTPLSLSVFLFFDGTENKKAAILHLPE